MKTRTEACLRLAVAAAVLVAGSGCGNSREFGQVRGKLTVQGQPADRVRGEFHPDAARGTTGPSSSGDTNEQGDFVLAYSTPTVSGSGAIVGRHKVVLRDYALSASETGRGVPIRFGQQYSSVLSTPLDVEVKKGEQEMLINVPPQPRTSP